MVGARVKLLKKLMLLVHYPSMKHASCTLPSTNPQVNKITYGMDWKEALIAGIDCRY